MLIEVYIRPEICSFSCNENFKFIKLSILKCLFYFNDLGYNAEHISARNLNNFVEI